LCTDEDLKSLQLSLNPLLFKPFVNAAQDTFDAPALQAALRRVKVAPTLLSQTEERLHLHLDNLYIGGNSSAMPASLSDGGGVVGTATRQLQRQIESHQRAIADERTRRHDTFKATDDRLHRVRRVKDIDGMEALLSRAAEVDLAFVIDFTFSMSYHWQSI
jgi:hypothetical protein